MSRSEFIRQAIRGVTVKPIITVSPVNDELLAAVGRLTGEYGKIGRNLNQIARCLNEYGTRTMPPSSEVWAALRSWMPPSTWRKCLSQDGEEVGAEVGEDGRPSILGDLKKRAAEIPLDKRPGKEPERE